MKCDTCGTPFPCHRLLLPRLSCSRHAPSLVVLDDLDKIAPVEGDEGAGAYNAQSARISERLEDLLTEGTIALKLLCLGAVFRFFTRVLVFFCLRCRRICFQDKHVVRSALAWVASNRTIRPFFVHLPLRPSFMLFFTISFLGEQVHGSLRVVSPSV